MLRRFTAGWRNDGDSTLLSIYLPAFILATGVSIAAPALPLFAKSFQVDFGTASLVVIVNQVGSAMSTLPTGYLIDLFGRPPDHARRAVPCY